MANEERELTGYEAERARKDEEVQAAYALAVEAAGGDEDAVPYTPPKPTEFPEPPSDEEGWVVHDTPSDPDADSTVDTDADSTYTPPDGDDN